MYSNEILLFVIHVLDANTRSNLNHSDSFCVGFYFRLIPPYQGLIGTKIISYTCMQF